MSKQPPVPALCRRVDSLPPDEEVPSWVKVEPCAWCQEPIFTAEKTQGLCATGQVRPLCFQCGAAFGILPDLDAARQLSSKGYEEMIELLLREQARSGKEPFTQKGQ